MTKSSKTTIRRTKNGITRRTKHGNTTVITKHQRTKQDDNPFGATSADAVPLSDEAALRKMLALPPDGQAMLFAMMRFVADTCGRQTVLEQAAKRARLDDDEARRGVLELIDASLLRRQPDGSMVLHKVFGSVAHQWRRKLRVDSGNADAGHVIAFGQIVAK